MDADPAADVTGAVDRLGGSLAGFALFGSRRWRRRSGGERCQLMVDFVLAQQAAGRPEPLRDLLAGLEELLADPSQPGWEAAQLVVLEELANRTSHADSPVPGETVAAALAPRSAEAWAGLLRIWQEAADHRDRHGREPSLIEEQYLATKNRTLKRDLASINRRLPDGRYVALADVLRYEEESG